MKISVKTCEIKFQKKCPRLWENLQKTESETVRFCESCNKDVYYVKTDEDALYHAEQRHCIAKENLERPDYPFVLGTPEEPTPPEVLEQMAKVELEDRKDNALSNLRYTDFRCTECGYPIFPVWREHCLVCGVKVSDHVVEIKPQGATE